MTRAARAAPRPAAPDLTDYPVREYISTMAAELAHMARMDADSNLAHALDLAADLARTPKAA